MPVNGSLALEADEVIPGSASVSFNVLNLAIFLISHSREEPIGSYDFSLHSSRNIKT